MLQRNTSQNRNRDTRMHEPVSRCQNPMSAGIGSAPRDPSQDKQVWTMVGWKYVDLNHKTSRALFSFTCSVLHRRVMWLPLLFYCSLTFISNFSKEPLFYFLLLLIERKKDRKKSRLILYSGSKIVIQAVTLVHRYSPHNYQPPDEAVRWKDDVVNFVL